MYEGLEEGGSGGKGSGGVVKGLGGMDVRVHHTHHTGLALLALGRKEDDGFGAIDSHEEGCSGCSVGGRDEAGEETAWKGSTGISGAGLGDAVVL